MLDRGVDPHAGVATHDAHQAPVMQAIEQLGAGAARAARALAPRADVLETPLQAGPAPAAVFWSTVRFSVSALCVCTSTSTRSGPPCLSDCRRWKKIALATWLLRCMCAGS